MPMIAFIGVRISWLMAARKALLAWLAASAASRALAQVREQARVVDRDRRLLRQADEEVEVGCVNGRAPRRAPHGHHAVDAAAADERRDHQSLRRPRRSASRDLHARVHRATSLTISGRRLGARASPMMPSPR